MKYAIILMFLMGYDLHAADWLCSEEASIRKGNTILACGIANDSDEATARSKAFDLAAKEFNKICTSSYDCKGHAITVEPKRTNCDLHTGIYHCERLISYTIEYGDTTPQPRFAKSIAIQQMDAEVDAESERLNKVQHDKMVKMMTARMKSQNFSDAEISQTLTESGF